jgi:hypothetical protein
VPGLKKCKLFGEVKAKITREARGDTSGVVGGAGKMLMKLSKGIWSSFKSDDRFLISKLVEKVAGLKEVELREMGLSVSSLGSIPVDLKIGSIVIYCVGGGCLS